jgi:hypothetical protein
VGVITRRLERSGGQDGCCAWKKGVCTGFEVGKHEERISFQRLRPRCEGDSKMDLKAMELVGMD